MGQLTTDYRARAEQDFEIFYRAYQEPIVRYLVVKWLFDEDSAHDLCQETFKRFWKFLIDQETALQQTVGYKKNWLYEVATNIAIDNLRHKKRIKFQPLPDSEANMQDAELVIDGVEKLIDDRLLLRDAIAQLPSRYQDSFVMQLNGHTEKEIAAKLGIKEKTVSANVSHARKELRKKCYPVTVDLQPLFASDAVLKLLRSGNGVFDLRKLGEYEMKARDWRFREYMRKHMVELRAELFCDRADLSKPFDWKRNLVYHAEIDCYTGRLEYEKAPYIVQLELWMIGSNWPHSY